MRGAVLGLLLLLAGAAHAAAPLRVVVPELPAQLDPHKAVSPVALAVARELNLGLTTYNADGALVPGAASWQISKDKLTYTFALRSGLYWSDGTAVQARDFVAGLARALDPATAAPFAADLFAIQGAEELHAGTTATPLGVSAPNSLTVRIVLKHRSTRLLQVLAEPVAAPFPRHVNRKGGDAWAAPLDFVGSGPMRVDTMSQFLALVRNPRVVMAGAGKVERMEFLTAASADAAAERVRAGEADMSLGFSLTSGDGRAKGIKADGGQQLLFVAVNARRETLGKRELRHALAMMLDRENMAKATRLPGTAVAFTLVPPALLPLAARRAPYAGLPTNYRAAIAEVLLRELNIDLAHTAAFSLVYPSSAAMGTVAKMVAASWSKLGVTLTLREQSEAEFAAALRAGDYDFALATWPMREAGAWSFLGALEGRGSARNFLSYAEADFDQRLAEADTDDEPASRLASLAEAEGVAIEDQAVVPIFFFTPQAAVRGDLGGWQANVAGLHPLHLLSP